MLRQMRLKTKQRAQGVLQRMLSVLVVIRRGFITIWLTFVKRVGAISVLLMKEEVPVSARYNLGFEGDVQQRFDELRDLLIKKHQDYGPTNISRSPGGPLNGLRVRMWDKIARINNLVDSGATPQNESLRDSFVDLANYSIIALLVLDEVWPAE